MAYLRENIKKLGFGLMRLPKLEGDVIDLEGRLVLPGLVNTHTHSHSSLFKNQADDLTLVAPAGMTLGEIDALLRPSGQFLPLDPPLAPSATIGGVL